MAVPPFRANYFFKMLLWLKYLNISAKRITFSKLSRKKPFSLANFSIYDLLYEFIIISGEYLWHIEFPFAHIVIG